MEALAKDTQSQKKITAILCRYQSDITIISDLLGEELLSTFHIYSGSPDAGPKSLLSIDSMRSCFIVVDARTMKDEFNNKSVGTPYKDLLNAARDVVGKNTCIKPRFSKVFVVWNEWLALELNISLSLGEKLLCF